MGAIKVLSPVIGDITAAAANLARIQAFVDAGGGRLEGGGDIYVSGTTLLGDRSILTRAPGTQLRQAPGTNKPLIATKAWAAAWSAATITWTAGPTANVAWTSHGCQVGDRIVSNGAVNGSSAEIPVWWDIFEVTSVTDADNLVITLPEVPTVAPTGTVNVKRCNRLIELDMSLYWDFTNNNTAAGQNRMAAIMAFIADSDIKVKAQDVHKYSLLLAGYSNVRVNGESYPFANSDTVKAYGPGENAVIQPHGTAAEDCFSTQALEPAAFVVYMPCRGNIRNTKFIQPQASLLTAGSGAGVIYSDDRYTQKGIAIEGGILKSRGSGIPAFQIRAGANDFTASQSLLQDITLTGTRLEPSDTSAIKVVTKMKTLTLRQTDIRKPSADLSTVGLLSFPSGGEVDQLVVDGVVFNDASWPAAASSYFLYVDGIARHIIFRNCNIKASSFLRLLLINNGSTVIKVTLENCYIDGINELVRISGSAVGAPLAEIIGGTYNGVPQGVSVYKTGCTVIARGASFTGMSNGLVRPNGAISVNLFEQGCTFTTSAVQVPVSGGLVNVKSQTTAVDIGATGINKAAGNMAFNTAARGTIPANVPVVCDGTNWYNATNLSQTF